MKKLKVLLVEDNRIYSCIIEKLTAKNAELTTCKTIKEAISIIQYNHFDIFLLDLYLPDGDSISLCLELKNNPQHSKSMVVFLSAEIQLEWRLRAYEAGAEDFIIKSIETEELGAKLDSLFSYHAEQMALLEEKSENEKVLIKESIKVQIDNEALIDLYRNALKVYSFEELKTLLFEFLAHWKFEYIACLTLPNNEKSYLKKIDGTVTPIEKQLFLPLQKTGKNIQSFGCNTYFKYGDVELIINNMPIEDQITYGRLKEICYLVTEVIDLRFNELKTMKKIDKIFLKMKQQIIKPEDLALVNLLHTELKALKTQSETAHRDDDITLF